MKMKWFRNSGLKKIFESLQPRVDYGKRFKYGWEPYLGAPEQNHHAATKGYADTKLSLLDGSMQGVIGMAGNRISHLGKPEQSNEGVRLSYANEFYLKRDGTNWMRGPLHAGRF